MLIAARHMYGTPLEAIDGTVGTLYDVLFDDQSWKLRHLVVTTDRWFFGEQALIDLAALGRADWSEPRLWLRLTKEQVRKSPTIESDRSMTKQAAIAAAKTLVSEAYSTSIMDAEVDADSEPHLRSTKMLTGMHIHCDDSHQLGHIEDFLVDDETWCVRDLVVDTRNWLPGKRVLIEPALVKSINWEDREVHLSLPRDQIEHRPAYEHEPTSDEPLVGSV